MEDVLPFPKGPKPETGLMLVPPPMGRCSHRGPFEVDLEAGDCKCLVCGERVTAIYVLKVLMEAESRWNRTREAYQEEMRRLGQRSSTKCQHCGKMTRISHR